VVLHVLVQAREFLSKLSDLNQTQIFAKIEKVEVSYLLNTLGFIHKKNCTVVGIKFSLHLLIGNGQL